MTEERKTRTLPRRWRNALIAALALVAVVFAAVAGNWLGALGSAPSSPATFAHYDGGGWGFDYPSTWRFHPGPEFVASFYSIAGYLASEPVDTSAICTRTDNSISCNERNYELLRGNVVIELTAWGIPMNDPVQFYDHPERGRRVTVGGMATLIIEAMPGSAPLTKPLAVTCSMTIERTDVGFWKMQLVIAWEAADDRPAGSDTAVQWLLSDGTRSASTGMDAPPAGY